jgi:GNAT superfamily N-acetyltransferase
VLENIADAFTLAAERDDELVGFCSIATPSRDDDAGEATCEVAAIYVAPSVWRVGIGYALLDAALGGKVRQDGWRVAILWVFAANASA